MNQLDHIVIAAPDLDAAKASFAARTGTTPIDGGRHVGLGTRNALVSFGADQYLEIIAPDPTQSQDGNFGAALGRLEAERLLHFAIRVTGLAAVAERARRAGFDPGDIRRTTRAQPDGATLVWELMSIRGHALGGFVPFYIDWLDCRHPAVTSPVVGRLRACELTVPAASAVRALLDAPAGLAIIDGTPRLHVAFDSPRGPITYESDALDGFRM